MSAFHYKAELLEQRPTGARYRFYCDYLDRTGLYGIAVLLSAGAEFRVESRAYNLTPEIAEQEAKCLSALHHKLRKMLAAEGDLPNEVYHIA